MKKKTVYGLRLRASDDDEWSAVQWYKSKSKRDKAASFNRIIGGIRTHSFEEKKSAAEIEELEID